MDPQTLPEDALAIYSELQKQYKVAFEPLTVKTHRLNVLKPSDLEQILDGKDPFENVSEFPVWIKLWEGAIVLADYFASQLVEPGTTLLELGGGLGVTGLVAAAAGYKVTMTDYEEHILNFQRISAAASKIDNVQFELLDWLNPPKMKQYDIIAAAEVLYREEFFQPLLNVFEKALKPGGVIFLAHDEKRKSVKPFLELAQKDYVIGMAKRRLKSLEGDTTILLTRMMRR
ncbi:class I SAM-dependent methyltransferase [Desulfogranum japonicum]|uniref:class I SAM-dependent methyltransferase n=1 Tax=Desulfogranum japonicum TaxID=231447 RepID=UPI000420C3AB|nr:methyltransferase domain-containing protein [Desulfogranum japonicum]